MGVCLYTHTHMHMININMNNYLVHIFIYDSINYSACLE